VKVLLTLNDVEPAVRLNAALEAEGTETAVVSPLDDMRSTLKREKPDAIVFSGDLVDPATVALVKEQLWQGVACIGLADVVDPEHIDRLRLVGYSDVYPKPVKIPEVLAGIRGILERRRLQQLTGLMGESEAMREVMVQIEQIAPVTSTVLIEGESGTGKELVARAIHLLSPRKNKPFIAVNVGALPETLLESELFGHEKGAFTGADKRRIGYIERAHGGTLLFDEIGDMPPALQAKLLRVLEEGEIRAVGSDVARKVDVRIVAATHQDLEARVRAGAFRNDLYYRLNVIPVSVAPLRERVEDVPLLAEHFLRRARERNPGSPVARLEPAALAALARHDWPGNVRELENLIERLVVIGVDAAVSDEEIEALLPPRGDAPLEEAKRRMIPLKQLEREYITWVVAQSGGNKTRAAEVLGIDVSTIHRRGRGAQ
jgi:two-component system response regulator HydG